MAGTSEVAAVGAAAVVDGMAGFAAAITAVASSTPQDIIAGTADGAGGAVAGTRGGCFQSLTLIHINGYGHGYGYGPGYGYRYGQGYGYRY